MSKIYTSADQLIGSTPLLELTHIEKDNALAAKIYAKLEYFNPAGSVKDRIAKSMIDDAEKSGKGGESGGNTEETASPETAADSGSSDTGEAASEAAVVPAVAVIETPVLQTEEVAKAAVLGATRAKAKAATETKTEEANVEDTSAGSDGEDSGDAQEVQEAPKEETKPEETKTIVDGPTAKAAIPELVDEKTFPWWTIILVAIAGITIEEYVRRKNARNRTKANESKDNSTR